MQIFFLLLGAPGQAKLAEEEARHCIRVLRHKAGDRIFGVDGQGKAYLTTITSLGKDHVDLRIDEEYPEWGEHGRQITLVVSPLRNTDRLEWLVEKSVELGVTEIRLIRSKRTVKPKVRIKRLERILVAALKQSKRSRLPVLHDVVPFKEGLTSLADGPILMGWCEAERHISTFDAQLKDAGAVSLLIGPEGDFTEDEVGLAKEAGAEVVSLGTNRLRTETAGLMFLSGLKWVMGY